MQLLGMRVVPPATLANPRDDTDTALDHCEYHDRDAIALIDQSARLMLGSFRWRRHTMNAPNPCAC